MIVEPGKLIFHENERRVTLLIAKKEGCTTQLQWREATDADLAEMGLVRKWRFDELSKQLAQIADICIGKEAETEQPAPHVWEVGDYALCPDGKVHKVVKVDEDIAGNKKIITQKHGEVYCTQCTPVPEPPMPKLPSGWTLMSDGSLACGSGIVFSLDTWITATEKDAAWKYWKDFNRLIALRDWRKLTGRVV